jgi:hypothetical protein
LPLQAADLLLHSVMQLTTAFENSVMYYFEE